jgi:hypothetical protein
MKLRFDGQDWLFVVRWFCMSVTVLRRSSSAWRRTLVTRSAADAAPLVAKGVGADGVVVIAFLTAPCAEN